MWVPDGVTVENCGSCRIIDSAGEFKRRRRGGGGVFKAMVMDIWGIDTEALNGLISLHTRCETCFTALE